MILFETKFSFEKVLTIKPSKGETTHDALTDLAWHRWHDQRPLAFEQHHENAYATIASALTCYVVTIHVQTAAINLQKAREQYIARSGVLCLVCLSNEIEGGHIEVDAGGASQEIVCGKCGSTWVDRYSLVRIDDLIVHEGSE